jgi:mannose-6-phosphate isomerase-like protein (cupin superfamily)
MAGDGWQVVKLDAIEPIPAAGVNWKPLRRTLGVRAFGTNAYAAGPGEDVVEEHTEERLGHEEVYVVLSGRATFTLDGETHDAPAGTLVHLADPSVRRHARAEEPGTLVLAIGGKPGEAYTPSAWEWYFEAERFRDPLDTEAALRLMDEANELFPDHLGVTYATACWLALAGRDDEALAALRRAVELDPRAREWAADDEDLASVRGRLVDQ